MPRSDYKMYYDKKDGLLSRFASFLPDFCPVCKQEWDLDMNRLRSGSNDPTVTGNYELHWCKRLHHLLVPRNIEAELEFLYAIDLQDEEKG